MGETGKRSRNQKDHDRDGKNQKKRAINNEDRADDELVSYRILCPDSLIGGVIGKGGKMINSIRRDTRAKVKVMDPFPGAKDRVISVSCYIKNKQDVDLDDDIDDMDPLCPAQDALMKVHDAITNALPNSRDADDERKDKEEARILVPTSQSASVIGKAGATIKKLRSSTRTYIKISPKDANDPTHSCAFDFDNFVQITGDAEAVKKALYGVSRIMYKFPPREEIPLETNVPEVLPTVIIPSDVPIYPASGFYTSADAIPPPRSVPPVIGATSHVPELHGYTDTRSEWPLYSSALPVVSGYSAPSRSEELKVRVLCPSDKIGRVIGKGGSSIKSVRQESGARVEVSDNKDNRDDSLITITSTESVDDSKSMAVEAVLLLQEKINDNDDDVTVSIQLLVPSKMIGCIIGKSGSIINEIRKRTKADVRISKSKKPKCAEANDELVEVVGEVGSVRDALVQVVLRLRDDVLKDRDGDRNPPPPPEDSLYKSSVDFSAHSALHGGAHSTPFGGYDQRFGTGNGLGMLSSSSLYGYGSLPVGENGYGSISEYSSKPYGGLQPTSAFEILIPANAVGKVMGKGGANINNIQKISGAVIELRESKSYRGDRLAQISGTPDQKRSAENLIQAFIMSV